MTEQENKQLVMISDNLKSLLRKKMEALPKNFNETRFLQNCMTVLSEVREIGKYEPRSVARTMLKGAFLGLDFFNGECYAIPYGKDLNFQTDYKGEIKVCKRWSTKPIADIYAKVVRKGDDFESFVQAGKQVVNFKPKPFSDEEVVGAFAVVYFQDGTMLFDTMSMKEIDHVRNTYSKQPDGKAWKNSPHEMYKKTVIRRICKMIDLNFDNDDQRDAFKEGSDVDEKKFNTIEIQSVKDPYVDAEIGKTEEELAKENGHIPAEEELAKNKAIEEIMAKNPDLEHWQAVAIYKEIQHDINDNTNQ